MERVGGRYEKMEGYCSTDQSPHWAVVPMEEEEFFHIQASPGEELNFSIKLNDDKLITWR